MSRYGHRGITPAPKHGVGVCPVCGWTQALTKDGRLHRHKDYRSVRRPHAPAPWCGGAGQKPVPVIHAYTDEQALMDGLLVDTTGLPIKAIHGYPVNRVTRAVWEAYVERLGTSRVTGPVINVTVLIDALNAAIGDGYTGPGDLLAGTAPDGRPVWFELNDVGGYTAMFPGDR